MADDIATYLDMLVREAKANRLMPYCYNRRPIVRPGQFGDLLATASMLRRGRRRGEAWTAARTCDECGTVRLGRCAVLNGRRLCLACLPTGVRPVWARPSDRAR